MGPFYAEVQSKHNKFSNFWEQNRMISSGVFFVEGTNILKGFSWDTAGAGSVGAGAIDVWQKS